MLFISNPLLLEHADLKWEFDDGHEDWRRKCNKTRFAISGLFLYVLTSLFIIMLNYPLSLTATAFPLIVLIYTIAVLSDNRRRDLTPVIFVTFVGFILKLITITMFFIIYPLRDDENASKTTGARKKPGLFGWIREEEKKLFFAIFFLAEFLLLVMARCLRSHFATFSYQSSSAITIGRCRKNSRRSPHV